MISIPSSQPLRHERGTSVPDKQHKIGVFGCAVWHRTPIAGPSRVGIAGVRIAHQHIEGLQLRVQQSVCKSRELKK